LKSGESDLGKFMDNDDECFLGDILMAAGFSYLEVTSSNKLIAYECVLMHDVINKRVIVLDDLRKGLTAERSIENTLVNLAHEHTEIRELLFPAADHSIDLGELTKLVSYEVANDSSKVLAKQHLEKYFNLLSERGKPIIE
jgi:hypothetical protein